MRTPKMYFSGNDDEHCYPLAYHLSIAKDDGLTEIRLFEAEPETVPGMFWCTAVEDVSEEGNCGRECDFYNPRNLKSGICSYKHKKFYVKGKEVLFLTNNEALK